MDTEKINYNEVLISGKINNIKHFNNYIAFGLTCNTFAKIKSNCFISFHIYEDLYNIYKDLFYKGNKIFVKGYLNSYTDKDKKKHEGYSLDKPFPTASEAKQAIVTGKVVEAVDNGSKVAVKVADKKGEFTVVRGYSVFDEKNSSDSGNAEGT